MFSDMILDRHPVIHGWSSWWDTFNLLLPLTL